MNSFQADCRRLSQRIIASGQTQSEVAESLGVSQSQISRLLSGKVRRRSKLFVRLCIYADSIAVAGAGNATESELIQTLREVWDGSPAHARALANLIRAVGDLERISERRSGRGI